MIVNGNGHHFFGMFLSDNILIQTRLDFVRCRNGMNIQFRFRLLILWFLFLYLLFVRNRILYTENIICTQPFGCLPNHIVAKGMARTIKNAYPNANIVAIDYDPGATRVNQENRIKLMLANARMEQENKV